MARWLTRGRGQLWIAEVVSRLRDWKDLSSWLSSCGFRLMSQRQLSTMFVEMTFEKVGSWGKGAQGAPVLAPCIYKRR
jgi:hypothetical protein